MYKVHSERFQGIINLSTDTSSPTTHENKNIFHYVQIFSREICSKENTWFITCIRTTWHTYIDKHRQTPRVNETYIYNRIKKKYQIYKRKSNLRQIFSYIIFLNKALFPSVCIMLFSFSVHLKPTLLFKRQGSKKEF